jgi:hypothetical protein
MDLRSAGCESSREQFALDWVHRQSVWPFLSLGGVPLEKSILPPKTREYRMDKRRVFV